MQHIKRRLFCFVCLMMMNCATTKSFSPSNYLYDRGNDMLDIFSFTMGKNLGFGAELNIGPISTGLLLENQNGNKTKYLIKDGSGFRHETTSKTILLGFGSNTLGHSESYTNCIDSKRALNRMKLYRESDGLPTRKYGRLGLNLHLLYPSVQLEFNLFEAFDFLLGILNIDIPGDDVHKTNLY